MEQRRWDIDERFTGVSDATAMLPAVHRLEGIDVQRAVIRLLSVVAEPSFLVRQAGGNVYDCVTGVMPGDPPGVFKSHGHLIRVIVTE